MSSSIPFLRSCARQYRFHDRSLFAQRINRDADYHRKEDHIAKVYIAFNLIRNRRVNQGFVNPACKVIQPFKCSNHSNSIELDVECVIRARTCVPNIRIPIFFAFRLQRFARQRYYANFNILKIRRIFAIFALDSNSNAFFLVTLRSKKVYLVSPLPRIRFNR